jgi:hypothetical protein
MEKTICNPVTMSVVSLIDCTCFLGRKSTINIPSTGRNVKKESIGKLFMVIIPVFQTLYLE